MKRVSPPFQSPFRNAYETALTGEVVKRTFLPSYVPVRSAGEDWPATCFHCGQPFNPSAYGYPKQHCRVCELTGLVPGEGRKG